jgi:hypothetical protein
LLSLGFGFALGILYDLFRIARLLTNKNGRAALLVQDILYCLFCTALSFFFFLAAGDGTVRLYLLGGEILGWLVYYLSFGTVALRFSEWLVRQLRRLFKFLLRIFTAPFLWFLRLLEKAAAPLRKCRISLKKVHKNLHFGLHFTHGMVYNGSWTTLKKEKGKRRAKQPRRAHRAAEQNRIAAAQAALQARPGAQPGGAGGGAAVRAVGGVPHPERQAGRRKGGRAKRAVAPAD